MGTTAGRGSSVKRRDQAAREEAVQVVGDQVEELARLGARQMLLAALEDEVNVYLGRDRHERWLNDRSHPHPRRALADRFTNPRGSLL